MPSLRVRSMVDLPAPLGPMMVVTSCGANVSETSDTASLEPYLTEMSRASSITFLDCGDLSPLFLLGGLPPTPKVDLVPRWSRQVATDQSGDRSPHSKGLASPQQVNKQGRADKRSNGAHR